MRKSYVFLSIFGLILIVALTTTVSFAYSPQYNGLTPSNTNVQSVDEQSTMGKYLARPEIKAISQSVGRVEAGDLFVVDETNQTNGQQMHLYLSNTPDLQKSYTYLILKVGLYALDKPTGKWVKVPGYEDDHLLTLQDAELSLDLHGGKKYVVTVNDGSFYCSNASHASSPQFVMQ